MEDWSYVNSNVIYDKVRKISGKKGHNRSGTIRSEDGSMLTDIEESCSRWERYIKELFDDTRGEPPEIEGDIEGPVIAKEEIRKGMKKMKKGKAVGPDDVSIEMLEAMGDEAVDILYKVFNRIYNTGKLPEDFLRSVLVALPKKPGGTDCKDHRTVSITNHALKMLLNIVINRIRSKLRPEIYDEQFGFMPDHGTRNAIFILRMLCERAIQHKQTTSRRLIRSSTRS